MENLDQKQQLPILQERLQFISQETIVTVHKSLCELISSLMNCFKMTHQERLEPLAARLNQELEDNWKRLNLENPGKEEYKAVTKILKTQTELLQQNFNQGRDASRQLLMALLRSLWKYFVFNSQRRPALTPNFASLNSDSECEEFLQAILRLSTNLQRNTLETALEQDLKMIIHHLKESTAVWRTQDSQSTRHPEDQESDILDAHPVL